MTLPDGELFGTADIVEGVWRHRVVVRVRSSVNGEQHAISLSVSKALALGVGLACGAASGESVLRSRAVKVVRSGVLSVSDDSATR